MSSKLRCRFFLAILLCSWSTNFAAEKPSVPFTPEFKFTPPLGSTKRAAQNQQIPLSGFAPASEAREWQVGDNIVALVTLTEQGKIVQYVMQFTAAELTEKEKKLPSGAGIRLYTNTGREFDFSGALAALKIRIIGPFKSDADEEKAARQAKVSQTRVLVNSAYLKLGLDRACAAWLRIKEEIDRQGGGKGANWAASPTPFSLDKIAAGRKAIADLGMTEEDERALCGTMPALLEFFLLAIKTPEFRDVLREVVDIPWLSVLKDGGKHLIPSVNYVPPFGRINPLGWSLPEGSKAYFMPAVFLVYDKPMVACRFAVIAPTPPLVTSAGIVGLAAQRPDGKGSHLMVQIVASRCAEPNSEKISVK
ncbi:MAG: hypothetical protein QM790_03620 [Nibricoccus sp.]